MRSSQSPNYASHDKFMFPESLTTEFICGAMGEIDGMGSLFQNDSRCHVWGTLSFLTDGSVIRDYDLYSPSKRVGKLHFRPMMANWSSKCTFSQPFKEKCISEVGRIASKITF